MQKTPIGSNTDGTVSFHYEFGPEEAEHYVVLFTGPINGVIELEDGSAYDVTDFVIPVRKEHVEELRLAIHKTHHKAGRFLDVPLPERISDDVD